MDLRLIIIYCVCAICVADTASVCYKRLSKAKSIWNVDRFVVHIVRITDMPTWAEQNMIDGHLGNKSNPLVTGLKITAGHRTMSGQDDYLSGQNLGLAVILTGQVRGFQ